MSTAQKAGSNGLGAPQETPAPRYKRSLRNFLLDPRFQLKYTGMIVLAGGLLFGGMEYRFYDKVRENSELAGLTDDPAMARELEEKLAEEDRKVLLALVGSLLALLGGLSLLGILATHRIVGPIYVVDRYVQRVKDGKPVHPRRLRRGDEFQELYNHVNEMATALRDERLREAEALEVMLSKLTVRLEVLTRQGGEAAEQATRMAEELSAARELLAARRAYLNAAPDA